MRYFLLVMLVALSVSCVSVPKEAPALSASLGAEISALETSHLALVHRFFDNERQKVREFVNREWLPLFAKNFFEQPAIASAWQQVVDSGDKNDRLEFILRTAPVLQQQAQKKYTELSAPLNTLENKLTAAIRQKYANVLAVNQTLTGYLQSASKVAKTRQVYLNKIGLDQTEIDGIIAQTAQISNEALQGAQKIKAIELKLASYKARLQALLSNFK